MPEEPSKTPSPSENRAIPGLFKILLPVIILIGLVVGALTMVKSQVTSKENGGAENIRFVLKTGSTLPDFELQQFQGKSQKASELGAKVLLVNFWATWCEACMVEMPSIIKLRQTYHSRGFEVAAVNVDQNPEAVVPRTVSKLGFDFPVYVDQGQKLSELFDIEAIPLTVLMDQNRKILMVENGERDWFGSDIRSELEHWLAQ